MKATLGGGDEPVFFGEGMTKPVMDADATPNPGGWPIGGVTQFDLPNNHLQYAMTWYGLALALVVICIAVVIKRRRKV